FDTNRVNDFFEYSSKFDDKKNISSSYKDVIFDRAAEIGSSVAGTSENAILLENIIKDPYSQMTKNMVFTLVHGILDFTKVFGESSPITSRYFASFTQGHFDNPKSTIQTLIDTLGRYRAEITLEKSNITKSQKDQKFVSDEIRQKQYLLDKRQTALISAENILKNNITKFSKSQRPFNYNDIYQSLDSAFKKDSANLLKIDLKSNNPFISQLIIDFSNNKVFLTLHRDIVRFEETLKAQKKDSFDQLIINEIARLSTKTDEKIMSEKDEFSINLHTLENASSYLVLNLNEIAKVESKQILNTLLNDWNPKHPDLDRESLPVYDFETYQKLPKEQKEFCLVVYVPTLISNQTPVSMRANSIYVIAKGLDKILQKYESYENTEDAKSFFKDF
ncbi:hypothetical protein LCGC14_2882610, partial [marine sediment metagenome]